MKQFMIFLAGLGMGSVGCWVGVKKYYEKIADEEIESVKEYYKQEFLEAFDKAHVYSSASEDPKEDDTVTHQGYQSSGSDVVNYSDFYKKDEKKEEKPAEHTGPYPISTDEFVEDNGYDKITVTFFQEDSTFMNEEEEVMPDGMELIGEENLSRFGEYEENVLYVRNEDMGADYEVLLEANKSFEGFTNGEYEEY